MGVRMSLPYCTRACVQPYPVGCTVPRLSGQIQSNEAATKVRTAKGASQWTISPPNQAHQVCPLLPQVPRAARISHTIVMTDALNIHDGILKLKKRALLRGAA